MLLLLLLSLTACACACAYAGGSHHHCGLPWFVSGEWVMVVCMYLMTSMMLHAMVDRSWAYQMQKFALYI